MLNQVWELPPKAELIAWSEKTGVEMFKYGDHIMGIQGHPEYTKDILLNLIDRVVNLRYILVPLLLFPFQLCYFFIYSFKIKHIQLKERFFLFLRLRKNKFNSKKTLMKQTKSNYLKLCTYFQKYFLLKLLLTKIQTKRPQFGSIQCNVLQDLFYKI